jgi:hypothetical protein
MLGVKHAVEDDGSGGQGEDAGGQNR